MKTYSFIVGPVSTVPRMLTPEHAQAEAQRIANRVAQRVVIQADGRIVGNAEPEYPQPPSDLFGAVA